VAEVVEDRQRRRNRLRHHRESSLRRRWGRHSVFSLPGLLPRAARPSTSGKYRYTAGTQSYCGDGPNRFDRLYGTVVFSGTCTPATCQTSPGYPLISPGKITWSGKAGTFTVVASVGLTKPTAAPESITGFESAERQHNCAAGLDRPLEIWSRQLSP
jgi:hypothetical protein